MRTKVFISDEGFGPIVRQSAIIDELLKMMPKLNVELQLYNHFEEAKHIIPGISYKRKFNNIIWHKKSDGSPDMKAIQDYFSGYTKLSDIYINDELKDEPPNFIISDFVCEAFEIAKQQNIPSFGVSHFTWDWFFSKMYPTPLTTSLLNRFMAQATMADMLFFPPFTPKEIIHHYRDKVVEVPFIVRKQRPEPIEIHDGKPNILIMDSGSAVNKLAMIKIADKLTDLTDYHFYLPHGLTLEGENITHLPKNKLLVDYIGSMDLVISRAGFNTITECIAYRTPMLLFGEAQNAEMQENNFFVKEQGLGSFTSLDSLQMNPGRVIGDYFEGEYTVLKRNMMQHDIMVNGAEIVAERIMDMVL
jgi:hypothetical protein